MSFCYLYDKTPSSKHANEFLNAFENSESHDISIIESLGDYDIYVIEIDVADKDISSKLNSLFKQKIDPLIYFIIPKKYNLILIQLMFLLGTRSVFTHNQESSKIISKINLDKEKYKQITFEKKLGELSVTTQSFMSYSNNSLIHVSKKLLEDFNCKSVLDFKEKICSTLDVEKLLKEDISLKKSIINNNTNIDYILTSKSINSDQKVIYFEMDVKSSFTSSLITSRICFIQLLKDKLKSENKKLSAITIGMNDIKKLQNDLNIEEFENYFNETLLFMAPLLKNRLIFAQLDKYFYVVLFEDVEYEEINDVANSFHEEVLKYMADKNLKSAVDVYTINLEILQLGEILDAFNNIESRELTYEQKQSGCIHHTSNTQTIISENSILEEAHINNIEFKLLNIYHGLVITTPSKIVKKNNDGIYVTFEQLQGVVMNIDKETVLQSNSFLHDIQASIKILDINKKVALLDDFKFLSTNANSRKYARVTTSRKIPITISLGSNSINGNILDLSIKSIAIKAKYTNNVEKFAGENVYLSFNIPNYRFDLGYTQLSLGATITVIVKENDGTCKIICDLDKNSNNESVISEYVYDRQKELIIEVKKMSKLV